MIAIGCSDAQPRTDRAPTAVIVTAAILDDEIAVSPSQIGAGPIRLVISNQAEQTRDVQIEAATGSTGVRQRSGPINPSDTATLSVDLQPGTYTMTTQAGRRTISTRLTVGAPRPSSNDVLLTP